MVPHLIPWRNRSMRSSKKWTICGAKYKADLVLEADHAARDFFGRQATTWHFLAKITTCFFLFCCRYFLIIETFSFPAAKMTLGFRPVKTSCARMSAVRSTRHFGGSVLQHPHVGVTRIFRHRSAVKEADGRNAPTSE